MELTTTPPSPPPGPKGPLGDVLQGGGVSQELQQTPPSPSTPPVGGISEQPSLFGRNVGKVQQGGLFGQQPALAPPTPILTPQPTPSPTPNQPVPMFGLNQQPTPTSTSTPTPPPLFGQVAPQGQLQLPPTLGEGEEGSEEAAAQPRVFSPTGGCIPTIRTTCVPCDPGLSGADCIPSSEWPPVSTTGEDIPQAQLPSDEEEDEEQPPGALPRPPVGETAPEDEGTQPQTQDDGAEEVE